MPPSKILQGRCVKSGASFHGRNKSVFLVGFSLTFPRFLRKSKNRLNTSLRVIRILKFRHQKMFFHQTIFWEDLWFPDQRQAILSKVENVFNFPFHSQLSWLPLLPGTPVYVSRFVLILKYIKEAFIVSANRRRRNIKILLCMSVPHVGMFNIQWNLPTADIPNSGHALNSGQNM